jgi:hypothetical protein
MDEPPKREHFGGAAAGPVFKAVAERAANYLNLKPEREPALPANPTLTAAAGTVTGARPLKNN